MKPGTTLLSDADARTAEMIDRADVFAGRQPLEYTTGKLSPAEVIETARLIAAHPDNASSVSVGVGFFDALLVLILDTPLDELNQLRAEARGQLKVA